MCRLSEDWRVDWLSQRLGGVLWLSFLETGGSGVTLQRLLWGTSDSWRLDVKDVYGVVRLSSGDWRRVWFCGADK